MAIMHIQIMLEEWRPLVKFNGGKATTAKRGTITMAPSTHVRIYTSLYYREIFLEETQSCLLHNSLMISMISAKVMIIT